MSNIIFESIYQSNYKTIYRYVYRMCANEDLAKDLCQDSFLKLFAEINNNKTIRQPKSWLYKTASNLYFNHYSRSKTIEKYFKNTRLENITIKDPELDLLKKEEIKNVQMAITKLTHKEQTLIFLYQDDCTYHEMANITGIKPSSVGKTLARTLEKLGKILIKHEKYEVLIK